MPKDDLTIGSNPSDGATPLPWTNGGPKGHSNQQQATVTDKNFIYKGRVIDMKRLEKIKLRLPDGVDLRIAKDGSLSFRARFRVKGYQTESQTFSDKDLAEKWLIEKKRAAEIREHISFSTIKKGLKAICSKEHYLPEYLPRR